MTGALPKDLKPPDSVSHRSLLVKVTHTVELLSKLEDSKMFSGDFQTAKMPKLRNSIN